MNSMTQRAAVVDEVIRDWYAGRADRDPYDEIGTLVAEVERLRAAVSE